MTRIEELCEHAYEICNNPKNDYKSTEDLCYIAMKWADRTIIDKACEWLSNLPLEDMTYKYNDFDSSEGWYKFIKDFRKAMEDEK